MHSCGSRTRDHKVRFCPMSQLATQPGLHPIFVQKILIQFDEKCVMQPKNDSVSGTNNAICYQRPDFLLNENSIMLAYE